MKKKNTCGVNQRKGKKHGRQASWSSLVRQGIILKLILNVAFETDFVTQIVLTGNVDMDSA